MLCELYQQPLPDETLAARLRGYEGGHRPWYDVPYALMPVHLDKHFVLLHIDLNTSQVTLYDFVVDDGFSKRKKQILHGFLPRLSKAMEIAHLLRGKLKLVCLTELNLLQQPNSHSCGVFICYFMIALLQDRARWARSGDTTDEFASKLHEMVAHMIYFYSHTNDR